MGRAEDQGALRDWDPDLSTTISVEHGTSDSPGNTEDLIKRGEELCEYLTVCPLLLALDALMTRSVQSPAFFPSQEGDRASPSEHPIATDIQGIHPLDYATPFAFPLSSQELESDAVTTGAVSTNIMQSPTTSYSFPNVRRDPLSSHTWADTFVLGLRYTSMLPLRHAGNGQDLLQNRTRFSCLAC